VSASAMLVTSRSAEFRLASLPRSNIHLVVATANLATSAILQALSGLVTAVICGNDAVFVGIDDDGWPVA
jgi:hypothetical protein